MLVLVTILVVLVAAGVIFHQPIKNQLNSWKVLPQPERLTELYFNSPSKLPTTYVPNVMQSFSFTVHNLEDEKWTYHYVVNAVPLSGGLTTINFGTFTLSPNQYKVIPVSFSIPDSGSRVQIDVSLEQPNQSIDFWMGKK